VVGVVLPVLPTTPFMIVALWAFSRSSRRFQTWLFTHRLFGPSLQRWHAHRVIPVRAKVLAITTMAISFGWVALGVRPGPWLTASVALFMALGAWFVLSCPSQAPEPH